MGRLGVGDGGYRAKKGLNDLDEANSETLLIIQLPKSRNLWRFVFFAVVALSLTSLGCMIRASPDEHYADLGETGGFKILPIIFRDLKDEGLIKNGHKGSVLSVIEDDLEFLRAAGIDLLTEAGLKRRKAEECRQPFDFVFAPSFSRIHLINGLLKDDGLVIVPLEHDPSNELKLLRNFKIVYLRRFESTVVGMRKVERSFNDWVYSNSNAAEQVSYGITPKKKRASLKGLEDVYLEPPRGANSSRKIEFLPCLMKDPLDEYPRRIFISDESNALHWFYKNYPTRDQEFEGQTLEPQKTRVLSWMRKNVRREDFVVMKAEAGVVEEMLVDDKGALCLVDELFMECKNQWEDGNEKRAYWECLTLYGKVKDEGIAVHQWWN